MGERIDSQALAAIITENAWGLGLASVRRWSFVLLMVSIAPACLGGDKKNNKPPATLPSAPTSLAFSLATSARIDLTWIDTSNNEVEFRIERSDDGGVTYNQVGTAPKDIQGFTDLGLLANKVYWYRVAAWNGKGYAWAGPLSKSTKALTWANPSFTGGPGVGRANHTAIYDSIGTQMIVFGGLDDTLTALDEVWSYNVSNLAIPAAPWKLELNTGDFRFGHSAVYDSANRRMIVFGGQDDGYAFRDEVFILDLASMSWSLAAVTGTPPSLRALHTAVYDSTHQRMIVHGGNDGTKELDDTYYLSLPATGALGWSTPAIGARPLRRSQHASVFDPVGSRLVLFGGFDQEGTDSSSLNKETWEFISSPTASWNNLFSETPGFTMGHSAMYDSSNQRMVVFGGAKTTTPMLTNEVWGFRLDSAPTWTILNPSGSPPIERMNHSAIYDSLHRRMIIYGGVDDALTVFYNEVWIIEM